MGVWKATPAMRKESAKPIWGSGIAVEHRKRLLRLREEFNGRAVVVDHRAEFWRTLSIERRRMLAVLAGVDDGLDFCNRRWELINPGDRAKLADAARDWARALAPMRWV